MAAAVLGAVFAAEPTGIAGVDHLWSAALVALLAWCAGTAPRGPVLLAAAAAVAGSGSTLSLVFAALAVLVLLANVPRTRGNRRLNTAGGALVGLALVAGWGAGPPLLRAGSLVVVAAVVVVAGTVGMRRRPRRVVVRFGLGAAGLLLLSGIAGGGGAYLARTDVEEGLDALAAGQDLVVEGDLEGATARFEVAERTLRSASRQVRSTSLPLRLLPGTAPQVAAVTTALDAAADAAAATRSSAAELDLESVPIAGGRVDLDQVRALAAASGELSLALEETVRRLAAIDRGPLLPPLDDAVGRAVTSAGEAFTTVGDIDRGLQAAPDLLGGEGDRRYLVLFTSPAEARNRFGFPGAYAVVELVDGRLAVPASGPINEINRPLSFDVAALDVPARAAPYLDLRASTDLRGVTTPADFPSAAALIAQMAAQTPVGEVDGVVLAPPQVMAALVDLVGGVELPVLGEVLQGADTVDFVTRRQYLEFPELGDNQDRRDLLADIADDVGARLEALELRSLSAVLDAFDPVDDGQLVAWVDPATMPDAARLLADLGIDAALPRVPVDLVHVGHVNVAANKIDVFLDRQLTYTVEVGPEGDFTATLDVVLTNTAPASGLPSYVIGSGLEGAPPSGTNRTEVLLYTAHPLVEATVDGAPVELRTERDAELFVHRFELDLGPGQTRTLSSSVEGRMPDGQAYEVVVLPNGLAQPDDVVVEVQDLRIGQGTTSENVVSEEQTFAGPAIDG